jgi:ABC transporter substrate binding protein (PQQ-dependent alcohol dehydrogenase system)
MQLPSKSPRRFFRQHASPLPLLVVVSLIAAFLGSSSITRAEETAPPREREGGFEVKMPQSPALTAVKIGYIRQVGEHPRPSSRLDVLPKDAGIAGALMGVEENNAGGRFTNHDYSLETKTVSSPEKAVETAQKLFDSGTRYFIVDGSADTLLALSDWAKDKDALFFNISATDVSLRQENCRADIVHIVPDRYMLADALAQYLVTMKWTKWLVVHGSTPADLAYVDALKRAAGRFGATIVDTREYKDNSGGRRDDVGAIPPGKQASTDASFAANPDYQIIMVADEEQSFGPYMPYRGGGEPRPVAGTTGLTATTWSHGHEKWGATQAHNNFEKDFNRLMLPLDYQAYVAARAIGEGITRNPEADFTTVAAFIRGPELQLAPFKGIKQQFRPWDGQFRQPIIIATDKVPVSISPQPGFPHASHPEIEMDTLGIDEPESKCKL